MTECQTNSAGSTETNKIKIVVNGESHLVPQGATVRNLLDLLELDPSRVAIELNREIIRQPAWAGAVLEAGAELEIVQFVGGG